ncbi:MAG: hypothetical protein LBC27_10240 [Spirochaetaceae bacterium]|nr:hypothetical protein [Spirochaetaceae bacterium]
MVVDLLISHAIVVPVNKAANGLIKHRFDFPKIFRGYAKYKSIKTAILRAAASRILPFIRSILQRDMNNN